MEKILCKTHDSVSPDSVVVDEWGLDLHCTNRDAFPIIYTNRYDEYGIDSLSTTRFGGLYHHSLTNMIYKCLEKKDIEYIINRRKDVYGRIWTNENIITCWSVASGDIKEYVATIVEDIKSNNYTTYYDLLEGECNELPKEKNWLHKLIDWNTLSYYWEYKDENDGNFYICREKVSELLNNNTDVKVDDEQQKLLHLMTPTEKQKAIQNNDDLRKEREEYYKEGENAWLAKHGDIDPAQYHLLMYQENKKNKKKTMKLSENDIKKMVSESVNRILNESFFGYSGKDFQNMGLKNPADEYKVNIGELQEKCAEMYAAINNFTTYLNGVEDELEDENIQQNPGFVHNLRMKHLWDNPDDNINYEDDENLLETITNIDRQLNSIKSDLDDIINAY